MSSAFIDSFVFISTAERLYKSADAGKTLIHVKAGLTGEFGAYAMAARNDTLYISSAYDGIYMSPDKGATWKKSSNGLPLYDGVSSILFRGSKILLSFSGSSGVYTSDNSGLTWKSSSQGLEKVNTMAMMAFDSAILAATFQTGIYKSTNAGNSWESANLGISNSQVHDFGGDGKNLFAATTGGGFRSIDRANSWMPVLTDTITLSVAASGSLVIFGSIGACYVSEDTGKTFHPVAIGSSFTEIRILVIEGNQRGCPVSISLPRANFNKTNACEVTAYCLPLTAYCFPAPSICSECLLLCTL